MRNNSSASFLTDVLGIAVGMSFCAIAMSAFALSYAALYMLAADKGVSPWWLVWAWPLVLDAVVIASAGVILWNSFRNERAVLAWVLSIIFTAASVWFNTEHAGGDPVSKVVFALPPLSLFLVTKLVSQQIGAFARKRMTSNDMARQLAQANRDLADYGSQVTELTRQLTRQTATGCDTETTMTRQITRQERLGAIRATNASRNGDGPMTAEQVVVKFGVSLRQAQRDVAEVA